MSFSRRAGSVAAVATGAALLLSACGGTTETPAAEPSAASSAPAGGTKTVTHAFEQEISSYNGQTAEEYSSKNHIVLNQVQPDVWYYAPGGGVGRTTELATYEKTSDDPLTVKYAFNEKAAWSDGKPIGCADALFTWAIASGNFPEFSYISTTTWDKIEMPTCKLGDKEVTLTYSKPFADWEAAPMVMLPPHIVAEQGGLTLEEMADAIVKKDHGKLKKAAEFFNKGWLFNGKLPDKALLPSAGPYMLDAFSAGQSVTLVRNEKYWGTPAKADKVVIRFIAQDQQVQALQNGETNIIEPQANADVLAQVEGLPDTTVQTGDQFLYDHLDFNFDKGEFKDLKLRQAFANCVPRQQIVDNLIKPQAPEAKPMDVRNIAPFQPGYAEAVAFSGGDKYGTVNLDVSKKLLAEAGKSKVQVKIGYLQPNPRRTQVVELIKASCDQAGFEVIDAGNEKFFDDAGDLATGNFDVALFGWSGSSLVSGWPPAYETPKKCTPSGKSNNKGCYSNKALDKLTAELLLTTDKAKQLELTMQIEKILWDDLATIPLYSQPAMAAWNASMTGVERNPSQASITWNMHQWASAS